MCTIGLVTVVIGPALLEPPTGGGGRGIEIENVKGR